MKYHSIIGLLVALASLAGCSKNLALAPPIDGEYVKVTVKVPDQLVAETMQVVYRSTICIFTDHHANGKAYKRDGYQTSNIEPVRMGQSDLYEAKLPKDGGGACQWRLSNVTLGVRYRDASQFGEHVVFGGGGGLLVVFDDNNSPRGGTGINIEGDLAVEKDYYPWLSESFLDGYRKFISLAGEGDIYLMYKAVQARSIYFEPVLHSGFMLRSIGVKVKKEGNYRSFIYPDGSVYTDNRWHPNFLRLQTIRLKAEGMQ